MHRSEESRSKMLIIKDLRRSGESANFHGTLDIHNSGPWNIFPSSSRHRCSLRGIGDDRERQADPPHVRRNTSVIQLDDWVSDDVPNDLRVRYQTEWICDVGKIFLHRRGRNRKQLKRRSILIGQAQIFVPFCVIYAWLQIPGCTSNGLPPQGIYSSLDIREM